LVLAPVKIYLGFNPCKYKKFGFGPWYFVLVLVKLIHIGFGPCNM